MHQKLFIVVRLLLISICSGIIGIVFAGITPSYICKGDIADPANWYTDEGCTIPSGSLPKLRSWGHVMGDVFSESPITIGYKLKVNQGSIITVKEGNTLTIAGDEENSYGVLNIADGTMVINDDATVHLASGFYGHLVDKKGTILIEKQGNLIVDVMETYGKIITKGLIKTGDIFTMRENGTLSIQGSGTLDLSHASFYLMGGSLLIESEASIIMSPGSIFNTGDAVKEEYFIYNKGTLQIPPEATLDIACAGNFFNEGTLVNSGTLFLSGGFINTGEYTEGTVYTNTCTDTPPFPEIIPPTPLEIFLEASGSENVIYNTPVLDAEQAAGFLAQKGFIRTRTNKADYSLERFITRAEITAIALKSAGYTIPEDYACKKYFSDVVENNWICTVVETAADVGIISRENKKFHPQKSVSRIEALAIVLNSSPLLANIPQDTPLPQHSAVMLIPPTDNLEIVMQNNYHGYYVTFSDPQTWQHKVLERSLYLEIIDLGNFGEADLPIYKNYANYIKHGIPEEGVPGLFLYPSLIDFHNKDYISRGEVFTFFYKSHNLSQREPGLDERP